MVVLIDTHILVWQANGDKQMPTLDALGIDESTVEIVLSAIVIWEIGIKVNLGKWPEAADILSELESLGVSPGFRLLPFGADHALAAGRLAQHHRDPFDRALIAQSLVEDMPIISTDKQFDAYGVRRLWTDTVPGASPHGFHET